MLPGNILGKLCLRINDPTICRMANVNCIKLGPSIERSPFPLAVGTLALGTISEVRDPQSFLNKDGRREWVSGSWFPGGSSQTATLYHFQNLELSGSRFVGIELVSTLPGLDIESSKTWHHLVRSLVEREAYHAF